MSGPQSEKNTRPRKGRARKKPEKRIKKQIKLKRTQTGLLFLMEESTEAWWKIARNLTTRKTDYRGVCKTKTKQEQATD